MFPRSHDGVSSFYLSSQATSDRFYRTLYESLLDPRLTDSNKQPMYLNLLFRALRVDKNLGRVMAFVKRLLQVMMGHQPPFICGALYLLGEVGLFRPPTLRRYVSLMPRTTVVQHCSGSIYSAQRGGRQRCGAIQGRTGRRGQRFGACARCG